MATKNVRIKVTADTAASIKALQNAGRAVDTVRKNADKAGKSMSVFGVNLSKAESAAKNFTAGLGSIGTAATAAVVGIGGMALAMDKALQRTLLITNAQRNLKFGIEGAVGATHGMIDKLSLMQMANTASVLGVAKTEKEFTKLADTATKLGLQVGRLPHEALPDLIEGLGKGSAEVLNNLGIVVKADDAYDAWTAKTGKLRDELTAEEEQLAKVTFGLEKAHEMASKVTVEVDETTRAWNENKILLQDFADNTLVDVVKGLNSASDALFDFLVKHGADPDEIVRRGEAAFGVSSERATQRGLSHVEGTQAHADRVKAEQEAEDARHASLFMGPEISDHELTARQEKLAQQREREAEQRKRIAERAAKEAEAKRLLALEREREVALQEAQLGLNERMREIEGGQMDPITRIQMERDALLDQLAAKEESLKFVEDDFEREMERERIRDEMEQVRHEKRLEMIDEFQVQHEAAAEREKKVLDELKKAREEQLKREEEQQKKRAAIYQEITNVVADTAGGITAALWDSVAQGNASFAEQVAQFAKAGARMMTIDAVRYGVQAAAAAASFNYPMAIAHTTSAGIAAAGAVTLGAMGAIAGAASSSRTSSASGGFGGGAFGGGARTSSPGSSSGGGSGGIPTSPAAPPPNDSAVTQQAQAQSSIGPGSGAPQRQVVIQGDIQVLGASKEDVGLALKQLIDDSERTAGRV